MKLTLVNILVIVETECNLSRPLQNKFNSYSSRCFGQITGIGELDTFFIFQLVQTFF